MHPTITLLLILVAPGQDHDVVLKALTSKSRVIVGGRIATDPIGQVDEAGTVRWVCEVRVTEVFKGAQIIDKTKALPVSIFRFDDDTPEFGRFMTKGTHCILFLSPGRGAPKNMPWWETSDPWFGIQFYNSAMAKRLLALAKDGE